MTQTTRKLLPLTAFVFALSFFFMGCNEDSNNGPSNGAPESSAITAPLQGAFMAHCFPVTVNGTLIAYANREINFINDTQFTDMIGTYGVADSSCAGTETGETSVSGTYVINGNNVDFNSGTATRYDIFSLSADTNTILFGDITGTNNGTTAALRPTQLSTVEYTREAVVVATPTPTATPSI